MFVSVLLWSGIYSGSCIGTQVTRMFPPAVLAWEAFRKVTLIAPWVASEASKVLMVRNWTSVRDAIRSTLSASPPRLGGRTGRDEYVACISKGQTKSNQEKKLWCQVCLHPHLEQGETPPVERWHWSLFSLLQMGANNSSLTPLNCILKNWDRFDLQGLKKTHPVFLCDTAWPWYPLEDGKQEGLLSIILFYN